MRAWTHTNTRRLSPTRFGVALLMLLIVLLVGGCAGGSKGTGGDEVYGQIVASVDQSAVSGATVTILATGDSAVTDTRGAFYIRTEVPAGELTLEVSIEAFTQQVSVLDMPEQDTSVRCLIEIDKGAKKARVREVESESRQAKPTPTPEASNAPTPAPTASSTPSSPDPESSSSPPTPSTIPGPSDGQPTASPSLNPSASPEIPNGTPTNTPTPNATPPPSNGNGNGNGKGNNDQGGQKQEEIKVDGVVSALSSSSITVRGTTFLINEQTHIYGRKGEDKNDLAVGINVRVTGIQQDGVNTATEILIR